MKVNLYSVRDSVAKEFGPIYCCKNDDVARRAYSQLMKDVNSPVDFDLYFVGAFDTDTGIICPSEPLRVQLATFDDDDKGPFMDLNEELSKIKESKK